MRHCLAAMLAFSAVTIPADSSAQRQDASTLPVVTIDGPTVIMFFTDPDSVSDPDIIEGLYAALDQQQTTMADTRGGLNALGARDVTQAGRRFRIDDGTRERLFVASPDSSVVGYVLAAPGRDHRVLYRIYFTDALLEAVRSFLGIDADGAVPSAN